MGGQPESPRTCSEASSPGAHLLPANGARERRLAGLCTVPSVCRLAPSWGRSTTLGLWARKLPCAAATQKTRTRRAPCPHREGAQPGAQAPGDTGTGWRGPCSHRTSSHGPTQLSTAPRDHPDDEERPASEGQSAAQRRRTNPTKATASIPLRAHTAITGVLTGAHARLEARIVADEPCAALATRPRPLLPDLLQPQVCWAQPAFKSRTKGNCIPHRAAWPRTFGRRQGGR